MEGQSSGEPTPPKPDDAPKPVETSTTAEEPQPHATTTGTEEEVKEIKQDVAPPAEV